MAVTSLDPAIRVTLFHEARRRQPIPPTTDLLPDEDLRIVREAEARRAGEKLNAIIERARNV